MRCLLNRARAARRIRAAHRFTIPVMLIALHVRYVQQNECQSSGLLYGQHLRSADTRTHASQRAARLETSVKLATHSGIAWLTWRQLPTTMALSASSQSQSRGNQTCQTIKKAEYGRAMFHVKHCPLNTHDPALMADHAAPSSAGLTLDVYLSG